jgi:hypothetical protein
MTRFHYACPRSSVDTRRCRKRALFIRLFRSPSQRNRDFSSNCVSSEVLVQIPAMVSLLRRCLALIAAFALAASLIVYVLSFVGTTMDGMFKWAMLLHVGVACQRILKPSVSHRRAPPPKTAGFALPFTLIRTAPDLRPKCCGFHHGKMPKVNLYSGSY